MTNIIPLVLLLFMVSCISRPGQEIALSSKGYERPVILNDQAIAWIYEVDGKQGLRDTLGNVLLEPTYDYIEEWLEMGVLRTDSGGHDASASDYIHYEMNKIGLIDYQGNILFRPQFDELNFNWHPLARVSRNGRYGYINNKGEVPVPLVYDSAGAFQNGFAVVVTGNGFGLINLKGEYVIEPSLEYLFHGYATGFSKDTMLLMFADHRVKMINAEGKIFDALPPR